MANFSSGINPITPDTVNNVIPQASSADADAIRSVANIGGAIGASLVNGYNTAQAVSAQTAADRYKAQLSQNLLRVADLEQRGQVKPQMAASMYRLEMSRAISSHPELQDDFLKIHASIVGNPLLGGNVEKDFQQEKDNQNDLHQAFLKTAQTAGWGSPDMPPEQQDLWAQKYQQVLFAQSQINASNALMEHKKLENEVVSSGLAVTSARQNIVSNSLTIQKQKMENAQAISEQQFTSGVKLLSDAYFPKFNNDLGNLLQNVRDGKMTKEDAISAAQTQFAGIEQQVSGLAMAHKDPAYITSFMSPYQMLYQRTIDQISGKTLNTVTTNEVANIQALHETQILTSDPNVAKLAAISNVFKTGLGPLAQNIQNVAGNILSRSMGAPPENGGDPTIAPPNIVSDGTQTSKQDIKQALDINRRAMVTEPTANDPQLTSELGNAVQQHLRGFSVYGPTAASPTQLNEAVKYFASPEFGAYVKAHPDAMTSDSARKAEDVYRKQYETQLLPLIQKEFIDTNVGAAIVVGYKPAPINGSPINAEMGSSGPEIEENANLFQPVFNGVGVSFKLRTVDNDGKPLLVSHPELANNPMVETKLAQLNKEVAPVMTTMVRAGAHFNGGTNYKQAYNYLIDELGWNYGQKPLNSN